MIARMARVALLSMLVLAYAAPAGADWICDFCNSVVRDVKRRQCWPKPFNCPDREAVRSPFAVMVQNGWQRQNTLGHHHFEEGTGRLNEAGRLRVEYILTQVPDYHRSIWVQRAATAEENAARLESVQQAAVQIAAATAATAPPVMTTDRPAPSWPALQSDAISRKFIEGIPKPALPGSGGGGGSGGNSGAAPASGGAPSGQSPK